VITTFPAASLAAAASWTVLPAEAHGLAGVISRWWMVVPIVKERFAVCPLTIVTPTVPLACAVPVPFEFGNAVAVKVRLPVLRLLKVVVVWFTPCGGRGTIWVATVSAPRVKRIFMLFEATGISRLRSGQVILMTARPVPFTVADGLLPPHPSREAIDIKMARITAVFLIVLDY
jgi:hypothetical protein